MKTLRESLHESLCENFFDNVGSTREAALKLIDDWCKNNIKGKYVIDEKTFKINSPNGVSISNKKLVEFPSYIRFGTVYDFTCSNCTSLKSLEDFPGKVGGDFYCKRCPSLKSLEGISPNVKGIIYSDYEKISLNSF